MPPPFSTLSNHGLRGGHGSEQFESVKSVPLLEGIVASRDDFSKCSFLLPLPTTQEWGEAEERGIPKSSSVSKRTSSPRPSPPSDGGEGVLVAALAALGNPLSKGVVNEPLRSIGASAVDRIRQLTPALFPFKAERKFNQRLKSLRVLRQPRPAHRSRLSVHSFCDPSIRRGPVSSLPSRTTM